MGCGASKSISISVNNCDDFTALIENQWDEAIKTISVKKGQGQKQNLAKKRSGWKTIRIFVSSTFKDFHQEREVLVKKVFPDLRMWCEDRRLLLIECDLRWGVPKDVKAEETLRACLGEIDRCREDNRMPFFVNMTCERLGWVPMKGDVPQAVRDEYTWVDGLSVTEMEIMHAAFRSDNPNALFMMRDPSFLDEVPSEYKGMFIDSEKIAPYKLEILKKMIKDRFPKDRVKHYKTSYGGYDEESKSVILNDLEGFFAQQVLAFFKRRIGEQYPKITGDLDPYQHMLEQHESFMENRSGSVLGRRQMQEQIMEYITGIGNDKPLVISGGAGCGKSSLMAWVAKETVDFAHNKRLQGGGSTGWHVFYHFVGAVPGSTELESMLTRLLKETKAVSESDMPKGLDEAAQKVCGLLSNPQSKPLILIVDALNQFDEDQAAELVTWVPRKLAPHIRCVLSMIPDTPQYKSLVSREPQPQMITVTPLDDEAKREIVTQMLGKYNKQLDNEQMGSLIGKTSSNNPLWLSIACEELRVFGKFREISDKINRLNDGLLELEMQVLDRFEKENGGDLLVAALCLLEVSSRGLLEAELLAILGDEDNIMPRDKKENGEKDDSKPEKSNKEVKYLPAMKWATIYRGLKPFLRPFGDSGEGRLDFYHRSLSKAVRKKYFKNAQGEEKKDIYNWWHTKLATFFETTTNLPRKMEEYPYHLIAIEDQDRLAIFLTDWNVFTEMFDVEWSSTLLKLWRKGSDYNHCEECYTNMLMNHTNDGSISRDELSHRYELVARFLAQAGRYDKAKEFLQMALDIEEKELGSRDEKMCELYFLKAFIDDEVMRLEGFMDASQRPLIDSILKDYQKSAELRKGFKTTPHKFKMGITLNRIAFYFGESKAIPGRMPSDPRNEEDKQNGLKAIDACIDIFTELDDQIHVADAMVTKGILLDGAEQIKLYEEALDLAVSIGGEVNTTANRLYINMGIHWELRYNWRKAYEYFYKWYQVSMDIFGKDHPRFQRCIDTLREPNYRYMAAQMYEEALDLALGVAGEMNPTTNRLFFNIGMYKELIGDIEAAYQHFHKYYQISCELYGKEHPLVEPALNVLRERTYQRIANSYGMPVP